MQRRERLVNKSCRFYESDLEWAEHHADDLGLPAAYVYRTALREMRQRHEGIPNGRHRSRKS